MTGDEMRALRLRLGLNQKELADALGQHRSTIVQYERGIRSKGRTTVHIPRVVELACAAIWAGFDRVEPDFEEADAVGELINLPKDAISDVNKARTLRVLEKRGIAILEQRLFFPWSALKRAWPAISAWAEQSDVKLVLNTVLYRDERGEGVSVLMFPQAQTDFQFMMRWVEGNDDLERPTAEHS